MVHEHPWAFPEAVQSGVSESTCLKPGLTRPDQSNAGTRYAICAYPGLAQLPRKTRPSLASQQRPHFVLVASVLCGLPHLLSKKIASPPSISLPPPKPSAISTPAPSIRSRGIHPLLFLERTLRTSFRSAHIVFDRRSSLSGHLADFFSPFLFAFRGQQPFRLAVSTNTSHATNSPIISLPITPLVHHGYHRDGLRERQRRPLRW